jgi:hypothetical protein
LEKGQHSLHEYVTETVGAWTNPAGTFILRNYVWGAKRSIDAPNDKIGVGSPFYARGYNGTSPNVTVPYRDLGAPWTSADGNAYQKDLTKVWLPGTELLADRIAYAAQQGLQHIIFWEMWHDLPTTNANSLLRTAFETRAALAGDFNADGQTNEADMGAWQQHFGAVAGVTGPMGDADNNNTVDGRDFLTWQRNAGAATAAIAVPEPWAHGLAVFAVIVLAPWRRGARTSA